MKLWKRVFIIVFFLFLCCFNIGMFYILDLVYDTCLETQKSAIASEAGYVGDQIKNDLSFVIRNGYLKDGNLTDCLWTYANDLRKRDIYIQYEIDGKVKYSSNTGLNCNTLEWSKAEQYTMLDVTEEALFFHDKGEDYLVVRQQFYGTFEGHVFIYIYSLHEFQEKWNVVWKLIPFVEILIVVVLALSLAFILKKLTAPLRELSDMAKEVTAGNIGNCVKVKGNDEVAVLAKNFNEMIAKIQKNLSDLEQAAQEKQQFIEHLEKVAKDNQRFIDNLGHELRTPLTSITGYAEYLKMAQVEEEERLKALQYISSEGHRLQKLSNTLLDLALLREDEIAIKQIKVQDILELMQIGFRTALEKKGITLSTESEVEYIAGNFELLCSLLVNLIENASRACSDSGNVEVRVRYLEGDHRFICIQIKDDGIGIQKKDIDKVEEPFYRVDKARSRDMGGVGLGVTLCKQIVLAHHGTMELHSEEGKGTCVKIILKSFTS